MKRQDDWLDAGLALLSSEGIGGVTIEALCAHLKISKGSFYHHFGNMPAYRVALMEHFQQRETQRFILMVEDAHHQDGLAKLRHLVTVIGDNEAALNRDLEVAVRAWAAADPPVQDRLRAIDEMRVDYLRLQCRAIVDDELAADRYAHVLYLIMIGANHRLPPVPKDDLVAMWLQVIGDMEQSSSQNSQSPGVLPGC